MPQDILTVIFVFFMNKIFRGRLNWYEPNCSKVENVRVLFRLLLGCAEYVLLCVQCTDYTDTLAAITTIAISMSKTDNSNNDGYLYFRIDKLYPFWNSDSSLSLFLHSFP